MSLNVGFEGAAKLLPAFGKGMNLYLGFEKLRTGDYVGAVGEGAGLIPFIGIPATLLIRQEIFTRMYMTYSQKMKKTLIS